MKRFTWTVEITVDETWVQDGYEATAARVKEAILGYSLGYAYSHEVQVKQLSAPDQKEVRRAQGYDE